MIGKRLMNIQQRVDKAIQDALTTENIPILEDVDDYDRSYQLGVDLFGADVKVVEQNTMQTLSALEEELEALLKNATQLSKTNEEDEDESADVPLEYSAIRMSSQELRVKIRFLRECSLARSALEDSVTLSDPDLAPNAEVNMIESAKFFAQATSFTGEAERILNFARKAASSELLDTAMDIVHSLRLTLIRRKVDLVKEVTHSLGEHISTVDNVTNSLSVRSGPKLGEAFDVLYTIDEDHDTLQRVLNDFATDLCKEVIEPLIVEHCNGRPTVMECSTKQSRPHRWSKQIVQVFEWSSQDTEQTQTLLSLSSIQAWTSTLAFLQSLLEFVAEHVLLGRKKLCEMFGRKLFGEPTPEKDTQHTTGLFGEVEIPALGENLLGRLLKALDDTCVPTLLEASQLGQLTTMSDELYAILDPLVNSMQANSLATSSLARLASFPSSIEAKYVQNRECFHLHEARKLVLDSDYHATVQVGEVPPPPKVRLPIEQDDAPFILHRSSVSSVAHEILAKCRSIMDEAASLTNLPDNDGPLSQMPARLRRTARYVLDMFRSIIPVTHGREISTMPRAAAVMHNDCVFFAYHCFTLGLEYHDKNTTTSPNGEAQPGGRVSLEKFLFVDMVPQFRKLAVDSLQHMLDVQASQILSKVNISELNEFLASQTVLAEWFQAEKAVANGFHHLRYLSTTWTPVLATSIRNKSLSYLVDVLLSVLLEQILVAVTISPAATSFLQTLCATTKTDVHNIIASPSSHVWNRFVATSAVLDRNNVAAGLSDRALESLTTAELSSLMNAIFGHDQREKLLRRLDRTPFHVRDAAKPDAVLSTHSAEDECSTSRG